MDNNQNTLNAQKISNINGMIELYQAFQANTKNNLKFEQNTLDRVFKRIKEKQIDIFVIYDYVRTFSISSVNENLTITMEKNNITKETFFKNKELFLSYIKETFTKELFKQEQKQKIPKLLLIDEVAEMLKISKQTVRNQIKKQAILAFKVTTNEIRILEDDLYDFLQKQRLNAVFYNKNQRQKKVHTTNTTPQKKVDKTVIQNPSVQKTITQNSSTQKPVIQESQKDQSINLDKPKIDTEDLKTNNEGKQPNVNFIITKEQKTPEPLQTESKEEPKIEIEIKQEVEIPTPDYLK